MKPPLSILIVVILLATSGCGSGNASSDSTRRLEDERSGVSNVRSEISDTNNSGISEKININTASAEELQRLPHVGASMAQKIIEHREKQGPFRRPEELMLIRGISDIRFRRIRHLIRVK